MKVSSLSLKKSLIIIIFLEILKKFFEKNFGEVHHVLLIKDKTTGNSRGFGYITMKDSMIIEKILASKPIFLNECKIDCKIAIPKEYMSDGKPFERNISLNKEINIHQSKIIILIKRNYNNNFSSL